MKLPYFKLGLATLLCLASVLALAAAEEEEEEGPVPTIDGAWRWNFIMPDGTTIRPRLTLTTEDGKLTGTTSFRPGSEVAVTNALLTGDQLSFQVVRQRAGLTTLTTYSGRWTGNTIRGKIESNWAGDLERFEWEAQRAHVGVEGVWSWSNSAAGRGRRGSPPARGGRGGFDMPTRVILRQEGETVTGRTLSRFGRSIPILHGSITNAEVSFEIERTFREMKSLLKYRGKQSGDTITGTVEIEANGRTRKLNWEAKRAD